MNSVVRIEHWLDEGLASLDTGWPIEVEPPVRQQLARFISMLAKWNKVYNLTAIKSTEAMVQRHLLDSLVLSHWLPDVSDASTSCVDVMDVGSGAGLPVLPLAMLRPDLSFASIESNGKKTRFQQQVLVELGLQNVLISHQRVQDCMLQAHTVTSRAFTAPGDFLTIAATRCLPSSRVLVMLTHIDRLPEPLPDGFLLQELVAIDIPGSSVTRHVAVCRRCM